MKIAIFGGSFDPVHKGHISLAENAHALLGLDKIVFVPVGRPSHKVKISVSKKDRLGMLKLALKGKKYFSIDKYEFTGQTPSYSYMTIRYLKKKYPKDEIFFLIGNDSLLNLPTWKKGWELLRMCRFISGRRKIPGKIKVPSGLRNRIVLAPTPFVGVSSSDIREKLGKAESIRGMVPETVRAYIKKRDLYRSK